jgi:hypothetical protein
MTDTTLTETKHPTNVVGDATVGELRASLRGEVIRPGDQGSDDARAVWNAVHDKRPALDPLWEAGAHNYFTSAILDRLPDTAVDETLARWSAKPTPQSEVHIHHAGGAVARVPQSDTAFSHRDASYILNVIARSADGAGFAGHAAWARDARTALSAYGPDTMYVNFTGDAQEDKVRASYPPDTYARLVEVKDRYDPPNMFRLNQNIRPSRMSASAPDQPGLTGPGSDSEEARR